MLHPKRPPLLSSVIILLTITGCEQVSNNAFTTRRTHRDGSFGPFDEELGIDGRRDPIVFDYKSPLEGVSTFDSGNGYVRGKNGKPVSISPVSQNPYVK